MQCNQINIPQVDTTELLCDDFIPTDCVQQATAIPYLGLAANFTQTQFNDAIVASLMNARTRIAELEQEVEDLQQEINP